MREMTTEMATLLKSKTMVGDNKPTAEVVVGGGGYSFPATIESAWVRPSTTYTKNSLSLANKANGKIIVCNMVGNTVYEAEADTVEDLTTGDNGATNWQSTGISGNGTSWATVWNLNNELYMTFSDKGVAGTSPAKQVIYKSPSGNGGDWTLYSTIQSLSWDVPYDDSYSADSNFTGIPIKLDNGDWVMNNGWFKIHASNYLGQPIYIMKSTDNGLTWSNIFLYDDYTYPGAGYYDITKKLVYMNNSDIYAGWVYYRLGNLYYVIDKSTDEGSTWTQVYKGNLRDEFPSYVYDRFDLFSLDGVNLMFVAMEGLSSNNDASIYSLDNLSDFSQNSLLLELPNTALLSSSDDNMTTSMIDDVYIISAEHTILGIGLNNNKLQPISIQISRTKGMAGQLTVELDNKDAVLAPDGTTNPQLLWPNKEIVVKQGYGSELLTTFTGLIDSISMSRDSSVASVSVSARDKMKALLDHYVRDSSFNYTITYENMSVEAIWQDLITKAGLTSGTVESTGILLTEKTFSWETYADAISWLDEISGFETYCDEDGILHFVWDGRPESVETSYTFTEGEDLITLGYEIDDKDLYYTVAVYGKAADDSVVYYAAQLPQAEYWNIPSGKVMRIDAPDADTEAKCQTIADKAIYLMQTRARRVTFETIGIPHLQRGDFIQVTESSTTISEIYRITDIQTTQSNGSYTMTLSCYYHAAPEVE